MADSPTPQNIVSITYQLLQDFSDPLSFRGQSPLLSIQFQDAGGIVRQRAVSFQEMLPYLRYLKAKAVSLGFDLICTPASTYDKKIVISYGVPPPAYLGNTISFTLDGVNFDAPKTLTPIINCVAGASPLRQVVANYSPFLVSFLLPVLNLDGTKNPFADYNFPGEATQDNGLSYSDDGVNYTCWYFCTKTDPVLNITTQSNLIIDSSAMPDTVILLSAAAQCKNIVNGTTVKWFKYPAIQTFVQIVRPTLIAGTLRVVEKDAGGATLATNNGVATQLQVNFNRNVNTVKFIVTEF